MPLFIGDDPQAHGRSGSSAQEILAQRGPAWRPALARADSSAQKSSFVRAARDRHLGGRTIIASFPTYEISGARRCSRHRQERFFSRQAAWHRRSRPAEAQSKPTGDFNESRTTVGVSARDRNGVAAPRHARSRSAAWPWASRWASARTSRWRRLTPTSISWDLVGLFSSPASTIGWFPRRRRERAGEKSRPSLPSWQRSFSGWNWRRPPQRRRRFRTDHRHRRIAGLRRHGAIRRDRIPHRAAAGAQPRSREPVRRLRPRCPERADDRSQQRDPRGPPRHSTATAFETSRSMMTMSISPRTISLPKNSLALLLGAALLSLPSFAQAQTAAAGDQPTARLSRWHRPRPQPPHPLPPRRVRRRRPMPSRR